MNYLKEAQQVLEMEAAAIMALSQRLGEVSSFFLEDSSAQTTSSSIYYSLGASFQKAIELLEATVTAGKKIVILGVGKSGHIGEKMAATFTSTGAPAVVLNPLNALHGDLGVISDGDLLLLLSYSGETEELLRVLPSLARFPSPRVVITGNRDSSLARAAEVTLDVHVEKEACPHNLAPTTSTTVMLALGDALAMVLLQLRGFTRENFAQFHPGGTLGRSLLLRVTDIMRPLEQLPLVSPETTIFELLPLMNRVRSGAALVISPEQDLLGIFTHGDFARHFSSNPQIGEKSVGELMTTSPLTIDAEKLAAEVLVVLEQHRIDDLIVVDHERKPVGMVDSQDLSRLKIL